MKTLSIVMLGIVLMTASTEGGKEGGISNPVSPAAAPTPGATLESRSCLKNFPYTSAPMTIGNGDCR